MRSVTGLPPFALATEAALTQTRTSGLLGGSAQLLRCETARRGERGGSIAEGHGRSAYGCRSPEDGAFCQATTRAGHPPQRNLVFALVGPCFGQPALTDLSEIDLG